MYGNKVSNDEWVMINNGIITDKFIFNKTTREEVRREFGLRDEEFAIVNVGRLANQKNHFFLIEIFDEILKMKPNSKLILVGTGPDKEKIIDVVRKKKIVDRVIMTGVRSDVDRILQGMDLFLMPSLYEGLPGAVIEAQGSSLPCLLSDTITSEVAITDLVKYISLGNSAKEWANLALQMRDIPRRNTKNEIVRAGFDMSAIAKKLEGFYVKGNLK